MRKISSVSIVNQNIALINANIKISNKDVGVNFQVHLSFLFVGHTHEDIDAAFSRLAEKLRKTDAITIDQLQSLLPAKRLSGLFDIKQWMLPNINNIAKHTKPLHFKFSRDANDRIVFQYNSRANSIWITAPNQMLNGLPKGKPTILKPPNFQKMNIKDIQKNIDRVSYLFRNKDEETDWKNLLKYLEKVSTEEKSLEEYSKKDAVWHLPQLPKQRQSEEQPRASASPDSAPVSSKVQEMLDKELENAEVSLSWVLQLFF